MYYSEARDFEPNISQEDLVVIHLNICSVLNKMADLQSLLEKSLVDVCLLNETWLNKENKHRCNFKNYNIESAERVGKKGGCGHPGPQYPTL